MGNKNEEATVKAVDACELDGASQKISIEVHNNEEDNVKLEGVCAKDNASKNIAFDVPIMITDNTTLQKVDIFVQEDKQFTKPDLQGEVVKVNSHHLVENSKNSLRRKRQNSCPPRVTRSINSGPWSIEWLQDQVHGDWGWYHHPKNLQKSRRTRRLIRPNL